MSSDPKFHKDPGTGQPLQLLPLARGILFLKEAATWKKKIGFLDLYNGKKLNPPNEAIIEGDISTLVPSINASLQYFYFFLPSVSSLQLGSQRNLV